MKRLPLLLLLLLVGPAAPARADSSTLEDYAWLIGVWTAKGTSPDAGEFTEELAYEWTRNRKFMKTTYVQRAGEKILWTDIGMVAIDPESGTLFGINFGMDGSIGWGRTVEKPSPEEFMMEGKVVGPDPVPAYRFGVKRVGEDALELTMESKDGDTWVAQPPRTYRRKEKPELAPIPEPAAETPPAALAPLAPFVGTWRAPGGDAGSLEVSFEWRLNRNFLRRALVRTDAGGAVRETVEWIGWDPEKKAIAAFSFDADGKTARATATFSEGLLAVKSAEGEATRTTYRLDGEGRLVMSIDDKLVATLAPAMDGTIGQAEDQPSDEKDTWVALGNVGNTPPWKDTRQVLRKVDDDTYSMEVQSKDQGQYATFFTGTYRRKKK